MSHTRIDREAVERLASAELQKLLDAATPGPWKAADSGFSVEIRAKNLPNGRTHENERWKIFICDLDDAGYVGCPSHDEQAANARLIAQAPTLAAEVIALRDELDRLAARVQILEGARRYQTFEDWHYESEIYGFRCERAPDGAETWLRAAWDAARAALRTDKGDG